MGGSSSGASVEDGGVGTTCGLGTQDGLCSPQPLGTCVPSYVPAVSGKGSCTAADVATFDSDCVTNFTNCTGSDLSSQACYHCLYSASSDPAWGVVVTYSDAQGQPTTLTLNTAGCLAATGASQACAAATGEVDECQLAACGNTCLNATDEAYLACYNAANEGECASYFAASNADCAGDDAGACADPGLDGGLADFEAAYLLMAQAMCE